MFHCGSVVRSFKELFGLKGKLGAVIGTLATIVVPFICVLIAPKGSWNDFLDAVRRVESTARRLEPAFDNGVALSGASAHRFTLFPMLFRSGDYADGSERVWSSETSAPANGFDIKFVNGSASLVLNRFSSLFRSSRL
jgi:hypothetical protein